MSDALIPLNQQDALPFYSTTAGVNSGTLSVIGNTRTRFWNAAALGLNSVGSPGSWVIEGTQINLYSNVLDFSDVQRFSMVVSMTNGTAAALAAGTTWPLYAFQSMSDGTRPPIASSTNKSELYRVANTPGLASVVNPGDGALLNLEFAVGGLPQSGPSGYDGMAGNYWRLAFNSTTVINSRNGVALSCELWGAS